MLDNFCKYALERGASVSKLEIPSSETGKMGIANPSILLDGDKMRLILRNVNYMQFYCDDPRKFNSPWGPLVYLTREDDTHLKTRNFLCDIDNNTMNYKLIDTSNNDTEPMWDFVGQEDVRLVRWDGKLYITGVQRDWNTTGIGRMHLSEITEDGIELSRIKIEHPTNPDVYCEKNWMPILDWPFHYVKWTNPTEIVEINPETGESKYILRKPQNQRLDYLHTDGMGIRGSSQVIPYKDYYVALTHMCCLWFNEKKEKEPLGYFHQFVAWDKDWNLVSLSEPFSFAGFRSEFSDGLAYENGNFYMPFALQDNFSFLLTFSDDIMDSILFRNKTIEKTHDINSSTNLMLKFFHNTNDSRVLFRMGEEYMSNGHLAASMALFERASEKNTFTNPDELYASKYMCAKAVSLAGDRPNFEENMWYKVIEQDPMRSEAYVNLSRFLQFHGRQAGSFTVAKIAFGLNNTKPISALCDIDNEFEIELQYVITMYLTERYTDCESYCEGMKEKYANNQSYINRINGVIEYINQNKKNRKRAL